MRSCSSGFLGMRQGFEDLGSGLAAVGHRFQLFLLLLIERPAWQHLPAQHQLPTLYKRSTFLAGKLVEALDTGQGLPDPWGLPVIH